MPSHHEPIAPPPIEAQFKRLGWGHYGIITSVLVQVVTIVFYAAGLKSDARDLNTRVTHHDQDLAEMRDSLKEMNGHLTQLTKDTGVLLDRTGGRPGFRNPKLESNPDEE